MKRVVFIFIILFSFETHAQSPPEPIEQSSFFVLDTPPAYSNIRTMAEWEEVQALTISWKTHPIILKQIVAAAREEVPVIILADNLSSVETYLLSQNPGGPAFENLNNVEILNVNTNSIWIRDYAANSVYADEVGSLFLVDWMYNRPRPLDDASPQYVAEHFGLELFGTVSSPYNLMNTGGNFMTDGFGTAFCSELVLEENDGNGSYNINYPNHTEEEIDQIFNEFMGIERYIKMPVLPYDGIHHIDMHIKLIDEETLLVGQFPEGVADGPQINANIEYVLSNFQSKWGTNYKVKYLPMPPSVSGNYADSNGAYRTYTNGVFVNNTIIIPTYREEYDTTAMRIWKEVCPGYKIIGIDCDNTSANVISQGGAIHCITHTIGVNNPLLISHQALHDTEEQFNPYTVDAYIASAAGVSNAKVFWKTATESDFTEIEMITTGGNNWSADIPAQPVGTIIHYFIRAQAEDGKELSRPMSAPEGYWTFTILGEELSVEELGSAVFTRVFPNPANAITCIELNFTRPANGKLLLTDVSGRVVSEIYSGKFDQGISKYFIEASVLPAGLYHLLVRTDTRFDSMPLMVK